MAPELFHDQPAGVFSDVFSLSTVLYWLCTGEEAFQASSIPSLIQQIVKAEFPAPSFHNPNIFKELENVILKGMQKNQENRFCAINQMEEALKQALARQGCALQGKELAWILEDYPKRIQDFRAKRKEECLFVARRFASKKQPAQAFAVLSRALSLFPEDPEINRMITHLSKQKTKKMMGWKAVFAICFVGLMGLVWNRLNWKKETPVHNAKLQTIAKVQPIEKQEEEITALPLSTWAHETAIKRVFVSIFPFADVYVDGKRKALHATSLSLELPIGNHVLSFEHRYAQTVHREIHLVAGQEPDPVHIELRKTKPAFLIVHSNVESDVAVNGIYRGESKKSILAPIEIAMPEQTHAVWLEIIVTKAGYKPYVNQHHFVAGESTILRLSLEKA